MPRIQKTFLMPTMRKPSYISRSTYTNQQQPIQHYRQTLDCSCNYVETVEIIKNTCCSTPIKSGTTALNKSYYQTHRQLMYARCQTYEQRQTISIDENGNAKSTCPSGCPTVYKPSNAKFQVQGAVSSSNRIDRLKYDTLASRGRYIPGYVNKELKQGGTKCRFHRDGQKTVCA